MESLQAHVQAKESVEEDFLKRPGVTGVAVGYKYVKGRRTSQISIQVFVRKKKDVPKAQMIPADVHGIPTDVIERTFHLHQVAVKVTDLRPMADTGTYNPVKGGVSIGPCRVVGGSVYAGTLGVVVRDRTTNDPLLLSNFHVMCIDNTWSVGDQMTQPSRIDTGTCPANVVGTLLRAALTASVDGAVCTLTGRGSSCEIVDIGAVAGTNTAALNMKVRKRGRTTGLTYGAVDSISLSVNIDYGDGIGVKTLSNQIGITPDTAQNAKFGDHGDSGSVVVDDNRKVVGLYFAGSDDGYGVANQFAAVLDALGINICAPAKSLVKDSKDLKDQIKEKQEKLEKREFKDSKDLKHEKLEIKEYIKDRKPEKFEFEGRKRFFEGGPKGPFETGPFAPPEGGFSEGGGLEDRVAQLEAVVGELTTFIGSELRPDLAAGALSHEPDVAATSERLQTEAAAAIQAKTAFDAKQGR